ncbi:MAG: hypothetical protein IPG64_08845 [Haliea sp.]|nr:hypothetical protein [Haliea sp.]
MIAISAFVACGLIFAGITDWCRTRLAGDENAPESIEILRRTNDSKLLTIGVLIGAVLGLTGAGGSQTGGATAGAAVAY